MVAELLFGLAIGWLWGMASMAVLLLAAEKRMIR